MSNDGTVYLLHFSKKLHHAGHYLGFTKNLEQRLATHRAGHGSKLVAAVIAAGITFDCVRTWDGDRNFERKLHRRNNTPGLCPVCIFNKARTREVPQQAKP